MKNTETVKQVYERFMAGDVPGILSTFDPDVEFRLAEGHPYCPDGRPLHGATEIVEGFFKKADGQWDRWTILPHAILETEDAVIVEGRYHGVYKPTGKHMDVQVCHVWKFRAGMITSFHQYLDTARLQAIMG